MKKALSIVLLVTLIFTAMTFPVVAAVDTTTSATPSPAAPVTPVTPATPVAPAPAKPAPVNAVIGTASLPAGDVYTVVSGDAFWKIAKKFNITIDQLAKLNPQVKNISLIYVGDKLIVKAATVATATPSKPAATTTPTIAAKKLYHGFGEAANYRVRGAGNLNITTASVIFDQDGKIVDLTWDVMEITTDLFPGWHDATLDQAAIEASVKPIEEWETKREEGYDYDMTHLKEKGAADNATGKEWFEQLDYFESYFKDKTVAEVEAWVEKYTDPINRRPYKMAYPDKLTDADKIVISTFTAEENAMLVDVTSSATMSLQDGHSHFMTALKEAYEAREEIK